MLLCASSVPDMSFLQLLMLILGSILASPSLNSDLLIYLKALILVSIFSMFFVNFLSGLVRRIFSSKFVILMVLPALKSL